MQQAIATSPCCTRCQRPLTSYRRLSRLDTCGFCGERDIPAEEIEKRFAAEKARARRQAAHEADLASAGSGCWVP